MMAPPTTIPTPLPPFQACTSYETRTKYFLVQHINHCAFCPAVTNWTKAIDSGYFSTCTGLTSELVGKHFPKSTATPKGHLRQDLQNVPSTKTPAAPPTIPDAPRVCTHEVFSQTIHFIGKIATDQTSHLLVTTSHGSNYIMVFYDQYSNIILPNPMKSQSEHKLIRAYSALQSMMAERSLRPTFQMLDNEFSDALKAFMRN